MQAYGLVIAGLGTPNDLVGERRQDWHPLSIEQHVGAAPAETWIEVLTDTVEFAVRDYLTIRVSRPDLLMSLTSPRIVPEDQIVHPLLGFAGAVAAHWAGRVALHAGAVLVDGQALVVLGAPGSGKSTLMSASPRCGFPDPQRGPGRRREPATVFAGPRVCDLRADAHAETGRGAPTTHGPTRAPWRERLRPAPAEAPIRGFVSLGWADEAPCSRLRPAARLPRLTDHDALRLGFTDPRTLFTLVDLPMWQLDRPRRWHGLEETVQLIASLGD